MIYAVASESPRGLLQCDKKLSKIAVSFHCLLCDFQQKPHLGVISPLPLPGYGLRYDGIFINHFMANLLLSEYQ